jgi:hypothetical protein
MKRIAVIVLVIALMSLATVGTAFASHGVKTASAPVTANGSVWFASGLDRYIAAELLLERSAFYEGGPDQLVKAVVPVPVYGIEHFGVGVGH